MTEGALPTVTAESREAAIDVFTGAVVLNHTAAEDVDNLCDTTGGG